MIPKKISNLTTGDFLKNLSNKNPTPGGGAAAALTASMAAALCQMVAGLTLTKKKYEADYKILAEIMNNAGNLRDNLLFLAEDDVEAYDAVVAAYMLSKNNSTRSQLIQKALKKATEIPLQTMIAADKITKLAKTLTNKGSKNANSDAKSALYLAKAAKASALENVRINLKVIDDKRFIKKVTSTVAKLG